MGSDRFAPEMHIDDVRRERGLGKEELLKDHRAAEEIKEREELDAKAAAAQHAKAEAMRIDRNRNEENRFKKNQSTRTVGAKMANIMGDIANFQLEMAKMQDHKDPIEAAMEKARQENVRHKLDTGGYDCRQEYYEPKNVKFTEKELGRIKKLRDSGSMKLILNPMPYEFKDALLNRSVRTRNGNPIHLYGVDASGQVHKHHHIQKLVDANPTNKLEEDFKKVAGKRAAD